MNTSPRLSFILATHLRGEDAIDAIKSILRQDYSSFEVIVVVSPAGDTESLLRSEFSDRSEVTILVERERRGPPAARNMAFDNAEGDIFVSLDDDAVFYGTDAAQRIVDTFDENPSLGILGFRSEDYETGAVIRHEIPIGPNGREPDRRHRTTYFVGVGAAFRADAIAQTEGFPEDFYYQMEELDLSFQILRAGYEAQYTPDITVRHKHAESGRPDSTDRWSQLLDNRARVAIRHLPARYIVSSLVVWTAMALYETRGSLDAVISAYTRLIRDADTLRQQRSIIDNDLCREMKSLNGRIWY